jgi:DNA repair exonuclease SbcCD ATPase subunit
MGIQNMLDGIRRWFGHAGIAVGNPPASADDAAPIQSAESGRTGLLRWSANRQESMERLQAGYQRMLALCQTIDDHLQSQRQQGQQVAESLAHLTASIGEVPGLLEQLSQRLERIAEQVVRASAGSERLSDAIDQLIPAQRSQNDLLSSVHRQLGESAHTNSQLADVLVELKGAMQGLSRSETERMKVFEQLADMLASRDREFATMLRQQNKAFRWAYAISLCAAAVVVVVAIVAMMR